MKREPVKQLNHNEEVEPQNGAYGKWQLQVNNEAPIDVTSSKLIKFLSGTNGTVSLDQNGHLVFSATMAIIEKPNKEIEAATYELKDEDYDQWLVFKNNCTVTIPQGLSVHRIFEGETDPGATVTFEGATGVTLRHTASINKTLSPNAPFGIRVRDTDNYLLYGTDPENYAG